VKHALARSLAPGLAFNDPYDVGPRPARPRGLPLRPRRIIAAVDFTPAGERAREVALALARASDAVLDLVHVLDAFDLIFVRRQPDLLAEPEAVLAGIDVALRSRALAARREGVRCVWTSLVGAPGLELGRHATRTGADLLVVGGPRDAADFVSGWGARALEQLLALPRWRGIVLRVPARSAEDDACARPAAHSTSAALISEIQWPPRPSVA
jgi:nucleotide-binding universal stress UspA family protein